METKRLTHEEQFRIAGVIAVVVGMLGFMTWFLYLLEINMVWVLKVHFVISLLFAYLAIKANVRWQSEITSKDNQTIL